MKELSRIISFLRQTCHGKNRGAWLDSGRLAQPHRPCPQLLHRISSLGCGWQEPGTRTEKQFYLAFDVELAVQSGCKFRIDETILSPDWLSNECIICAYDAINREFAWVNRPYELTRNGYNAMVKPGYMIGNNDLTQQRGYSGITMGT